jgi:DNA-binding Lrp family transcriptional regulator
VLQPNRIGASTLAALAVPAARIDEVAAMVSEYPEVNHNYQREHRFNLWFVVTAPDRASLDAVLSDIETRSGLPLLDLPMQEDYFIDLGFRLQWT